MNIVTARRLKAGLLAVCVAAAALVLAPTADAHAPSAAITCATWQISATNYETGQDNTWSVSIDGSVPVTGHFGAAFSDSGTFPADSGNHTLVGHVWQDNNPAGQYSHDYNLSTQGCTVPSSTPPTSETPTSPSETPTSVTPSTSTAVPTPTTSAPATHGATVAPSTSHAAPVVRPVAHTTPLASTGPHTGALIGVGICMLVGGVVLLLLANRRGDHS